jgi:hypothetical protein
MASSNPDIDNLKRIGKSVASIYSRAEKSNSQFGTRVKSESHSHFATSNISFFDEIEQFVEHKQSRTNIVSFAI